MKKRLTSTALFLLISTSAFADQYITPGQSAVASYAGETVTCYTPSQPSNCSVYTTMHNEVLRPVLRGGIGNCYVNSFRGSPDTDSRYRCSLMVRGSDRVVRSTFGDRSCHSLFNEVKLMMALGAYESECGRCF